MVYIARQKSEKEMTSKKSLHQLAGDDEANNRKPRKSIPRVKRRPRAKSSYPPRT
jgi:hypothetical protein